MRPAPSGGHNSESKHERVSRPQNGRPHDVIIDAGFACISAAKALRQCEADVTLIDRRNHHIFQPHVGEEVSSDREGSDDLCPSQSRGNPTHLTNSQGGFPGGGIR
jgi:hypothetical protein